MKRILISLALVGMVFIPAMLLAQAQTTGGIRGVVVDESGAGVADAIVTATSQSLQLEREAVSGDNGEFRFVNLQVGNYTVVISALGMQPQVMEFRVSVGQTVPLSVTLLPGEAISQTVTVYGAASNMEVTSTGETLDYDKQVEELPIQNRNLNSVASFAPNITFNPNNNLSISGAPGTDTVVLLDGAEVSDPYFGSAPTLFLEDAIEEVQVMTSGVSARYGRFQGGVINAITKSGGNQFEVTLRGEFTNDSWDSQTPFGEEQVDEVDKVYQLTGGGYMWKDHAWFFGGWREVPDTSTASTTDFDGQTYTTVRSQERWQIKLRGAVSANHIVDISYLSDETLQTDRAGLPPGDIKATNGIRADPRETQTLSYQGVLTSSLFMDLQVTQKEVSIASGGDPAGQTPLFTISPFAFWNNHWWDASDPSVRDNETAAANLSYALDTENMGSHFIEGGIQYVNSITGGENRQSPTGYNIIMFTGDDFVGFNANGDALFNLHTGGAERWDALSLGGENEIENIAFYVQDTITLGKFRLDLGLRYDDVSSSSPLAFQNFSYTDWSPRIALAYNIDETWQLMATYGKYLGRLNDNIFGNATGVGSAPNVTADYTGPSLFGVTGDVLDAASRDDSLWTRVTALVDPNQPTTFMESGVGGPYADDFTLSVRRALPRNTGSFTLSYHHRKFNDLMDDFVGGVCSDHDLSFDSGGNPACDTITVQTPGDTVLDTTVWANNPQAKRDYDAISASWEFRPNAKISWFGNYTFSEVSGNYEGEGTNQPANGSPIGNYTRARPTEAAEASGLLDEDLKHRLITGLTYNFDFNRAGRLAIGGVVTYQSGDVWSKTSSEPVSQTVPEYAVASGTYTHFFEGRGSNRMEDWWRGDLSLRYSIPVWSRLDFWAKISALNVTNASAVRSMQTTASGEEENGVLVWVPAGSCGPGEAPSEDCSSFGRIRNEDDYQLPRTYLLTLGFNF